MIVTLATWDLMRFPTDGVGREVAASKTGLAVAALTVERWNAW